MPRIHRRTALITALFALVGALCFSPTRLIGAEELPSQLSDEVFWKLISDFSEPGGYFRSENFVSNESRLQWVIEDLKKNTKPGGAYLGVGPDQNFTYIVALNPKIAFIVDIRRQNMLEHLMYKALFELAENRADFLSRLFSRTPKTEIGSNSSPAELFAAFENVPAEGTRFRDNLEAILELLQQDHGFALTNEDNQSIEHVFRAFFIAGPTLSYDGPMSPTRNPSYADLMMQTDQTGQNHSYMQSEENFRSLQQLQKKNLVVPLVGDFAGQRALQSVGEYLKEHSMTVTAFYASNVEQYLFQQDDDWNKFYRNVGFLPVDTTSTFIRSAFISNFGRRPSPRRTVRPVQMLSSIPEFLRAFKAGEITTYLDVLKAK